MARTASCQPTFFLFLALCLCTTGHLCARRTPAPLTGGGQDPEFKQRRIEMVSGQIEARGIRDTSVLAAMRKVPRHLFVHPDLVEFAYSDQPLPIGLDQTISQPYIVAFMTEQLELERNHKVLEVGTGSGYQAAVLAEIVDSVWSIEILTSLASAASERLGGLGYHNVDVRCGDGYVGWPEHAPFDAIIVTAAAEEIPQPLVDQLNDGGRMIIPVGNRFSVQHLVLVEKRGDRVSRRNVGPVRFVPLLRNSTPER